MTSFGRALSLVLCVVSAAPAAAAPVLLVRTELSGVDPAAAERIDASLRTEARSVLKERLQTVSPVRPQGCESEEACAAALASAYGAERVVIPGYSVIGASHRVRVRLHDASGALLSTAERQLASVPQAKVWRGVVQELLAPNDYVGALRFLNVTEGAQVSVDYLALSQRELSAPYGVSAGRHVVEVSAPGYLTLRRDVDVAYSEVTDVDGALSPVGSSANAGEPPPVASAPQARVPWWPAAVAGGLAGTASLVALVAGIDWAVTGAAVAQDDAGLQNFGGFDAHRYAAELLPRTYEAGLVSERRAAVRTDQIIAAVAGSIGVVAGIAAAAFAARWALADDEAAP